MRRYVVGIILCLFFFFVFVLTLKDYGMNEDSPFHFLRGQIFLQVLLKHEFKFNQPHLPSPVMFIPGQRISSYKFNAYEGNLAPKRPIAVFDRGPTFQEIFQSYLKKAGRYSLYKHNAWNFDYFNSPPAGHPPIGDILMAASNRLMYEKLGLFPDIEAYYLFVIMTAILALAMVFLFTLKVFNLDVAILSTLFLGFYPFFFAESHFNIKDIPQMAFFTTSLVAFFFLTAAKSKKWLTIFILSFFLGAGIKLNIAFLPIIVVPWLLFIKNTKEVKQWSLKEVLMYLLIFFVGIFVLFLMFWPYVWQNMFQKILDTLAFYKQVGSYDIRIQENMPYVLPFGVNLSPLLTVIGGTPLLTLTSFILGFLVIFKQKSSFPAMRPALFIFLWLLIPLLRAAWAGADFFGSIRQYVEFLPALAIVAGIGASKMVDYVRLKITSNKSKLVLAFIFFILLTLPVIRYHPNENIFFNVLIGGVKGASAKKIYNWQSSYGNPYRQAVDWLNKHAEKSAKLAYLDGTMQSISLSWIRPDIRYGSFFSGYDRTGEYIISLVYPDVPLVFPYLYLDRFLRPVYEVKVDGVAIIRIWKNSDEFVKKGYEKISSIKNFKRIDGSDTLGSYWQINLDRDYMITKVSVKIPKSNCERREGVFRFNTYLVTSISERKGLFELSVPAQRATNFRFYATIPNSCFVKGEVVEVDALQ